MAEPWLAALGLGLVLVALGWRALLNRQGRVNLARALASPDPAVRVVALRELGSSGLRPYAKVIARTVESGVDDPVASEVARLVIANQWEPADDQWVLHLRNWAVEYCRVHGDPFTRPRPPDSQPETKDAAPAATPATSSPSAQLSLPLVGDQLAVSALELRLAAMEARLPAVQESLSRVEALLRAEQEHRATTVRVSSPRPMAQALPTDTAPAAEQPGRPAPSLVVAVESLLGTTVVWLRYLPARGARRLPLLPVHPPMAAQATATAPVADATGKPKLVVATESALGTAVRRLAYEPVVNRGGWIPLPSVAVSPPPPADDVEKPPLVQAVEAALAERVAWLRYQPAAPLRRPRVPQGAR